MDPKLVANEPVDPDEVLTYRTNVTTIAIDPRTGLISWTPTNADALKGMFVVRITVGDEYSEMVHVEMVITVMNVNDPPEITSMLGIEDGMDLRIGDAYSLTGTASDIDDAPEIITFVWYADDVVIGRNAAIEWTPDAMGLTEVKLTVSDASGTEVSTVVTVNVRWASPPLPQIKSPEDQYKTRKGNDIIFTFEYPEGSIPPSETLTITVTSDISGTIMTLTSAELLNFTVDDLPVGAHRINVTVSDGERESMTGFNLTVKKRPTEDTPALGAAACALILVSSALVLARRRGRWDQ